jgi:hypothetical protein
VPWIDAVAAGLSALADAAEHGERAIGALESAAARAESAGLGLHARALRRRAAALAGDRETIDAIDAKLRLDGVVRPDRLLAIYAPG